MSRKLILLGVLSLILAPGAALSLGLGDIRLNSYLNQPMDAEITLTVGSPAELNSLEIRLAPTAAYSRHGLDRPAFLDDLRFQVRRTGSSSAVVQVSSTRPIAEPFVTFLVEAAWSGGQMLREYTVLLDPPTFMPASEAAPARPAAVDVPRPAPVTRPAPAPAPRAMPAPLDRDYGGQYGPVQRNDTLWGIAQRVRPDTGLSTNQVMVALFRANPGAFDGNINRLRAGAILRVPGRAELAALPGREATAEVRRHNEAWRAAAAPAAERRLELAPPAEAPPAAPAADPVRGTTATSPAVMEAVNELRGELAETRRLMEVKDAEIAALQARLAELEDEGVPVAELPTAPVERPVPAEEPAEQVPGEEGAAGADEPPAEAAPAAAPEPETAPVPVAPPVAPAPTLIDRVTALLGSLWLWLVLAVVLVAAAVVVFLRKRKDDERSIEEDLAETGTWSALDEEAGDKAGAAGLKIQPRASRDDDLESILVEEAERPAPPKVSGPAPVPAPEPEPRHEDDYQYPFEDTIAGETGINLDQTDPMAEADFHMAYGLYDQAAEIIKKAIEREPDRYDLRRKLIDICFVWGNAEEFLAQAKAVRQLGGEVQAADWAKVSIMGRQICPGEPLFAVGEAPSVDVDFGDDEADLAAMGKDTGSSGEWLDFDVGESDGPTEALGDTREQPAPGARRPIEQTAELDLEELGIDLDLGESGQHALQDLGDLPEDESDDESHTGTLRLTEPPSFGEAERDETSFETRIGPAGDGDEAGGTLVMDTSGMPQDGDDATQRGQGLELSEDEPTLSGMTGLDEDDVGDPTMVQEAQVHEDAEDMPTLSGLSALDEEEGDEGTQITRFEASDSSATAEVGTIDEDLDLDLDELTHVLESDLESGKEQDEDATQLARSPSSDSDATMMAPGLGVPRGEDDDATMVTPAGETGATGEGYEYEEGDTREMPPVDISADDINEVGTKLDLARAYIDMGDPEGARSILEEVVEEGDEGQRDEARELLDSLD